MAKLSKLQRSNNAHLRLQHKYNCIVGKSADIKYYYHLRVRELQKDKKRILSNKERRGIFSHVSKLVNKK